jgi:hypothetical protein
VLLVVFVALWVRSRTHIDEVVMRVGASSRVEVASLPGGIRVMTFAGWPDPVAVSVTSVPRTAKAEQDWRYYDGTTAVAGRKGWAGFWRDEGGIGGPGLGRGVAYRAWTVPYWAIVGVLLVPVVGRAGLIALRRRQWGPGCCAKCGYDLRATPERCPECGTVYRRVGERSGLSLSAPIPA